MDYKSAYYLLFNRITDIISELEDMQVQAEETAVCGDAPAIRILPDREAGEED